MFYLVAQVRKQKKKWPLRCLVGVGSSTLHVNKNEDRFIQGDSRRLKVSLKIFCEYCKGDEHTKDKCFQHMWHYDWYKGKCGGKRSSKIAANAMIEENHELDDNPLEFFNIWFP